MELETRMKRWIGMPFAAVVLTACVTINVYFPAAEAKEAAKEFVEKVIGDQPQQAAPANPGGMALRGPSADTGFDPWILLGIGQALQQGRPVDLAVEADHCQLRQRSAFDNSKAGAG